MDTPFVLDKPLILERLGGDEDIFLMMVDMFVQDVDTYCNQLGDAFAAANVPLVQREAHTIKGLLASFGDDAGTKAAYAIELQAKQGSLDGLAPKVAELQARIRDVVAVLQRPD